MPSFLGERGRKTIQRVNYCGGSKYYLYGIERLSIFSKPGEISKKKSTGENSKKTNGDGAPLLQISVPCRGRTHSEKNAVFGAPETFDTEYDQAKVPPYNGHDPRPPLLV